VQTLQVDWIWRKVQLAKIFKEVSCLLLANLLKLRLCFYWPVPPLFCSLPSGIHNPSSSSYLLPNVCMCIPTLLLYRGHKQAWNSLSLSLYLFLSLSLSLSLFLSLSLSFSLSLFFSLSVSLSLFLSLCLSLSFSLFLSHSLYLSFSLSLSLSLSLYLSLSLSLSLKTRKTEELGGRIETKQTGIPYSHVSVAASVERTWFFSTFTI
jgi:hypothetical protein